MFTGIYHAAIRYPDRRSLTIALKQVLSAGIPISGAADHGVSHSVYLADREGNGIELTYDLPKDQWPRIEGDRGYALVTRPLDLDDLLGLATEKRNPG